MARSEFSRPLDQRLTSSISSALRTNLLRVLNERSATPVDLADAVDEDLPVVLDELFDLWSDGSIEVADRRGGPADPAEHRYRIAPFFFIDDRASDDLSQADRERISTTMLQTILTEVISSLRSGTLDARPDRHLSWLPVRVDEEGWHELSTLLMRTLKEAEAIGDRCSERLNREGEEGVDVLVSLMGFERSKGRAA